jgi:hypothetical protein
VGSASWGEAEFAHYAATQTRHERSASGEAAPACVSRALFAPAADGQARGSRRASHDGMLAHAEPLDARTEPMLSAEAKRRQRRQRFGTATLAAQP